MTTKTISTKELMEQGFKPYLALLENKNLPPGQKRVVSTIFAKSMKYAEERAKELAKEQGRSLLQLKGLADADFNPQGLEVSPKDIQVVGIRADKNIGMLYLCQANVAGILRQFTIHTENGIVATLKQSEVTLATTDPHYKQELYNRYARIINKRVQRDHFVLSPSADKQLYHWYWKSEDEETAHDMLVSVAPVAELANVLDENKAALEKVSKKTTKATTKNQKAKAKKKSKDA